MTAYLLETRSLKKYFGRQPAVNGVSLQIPAGSIYGLLGPNGAGKTTTLKMLTGLLRPGSGEITVFGEPWQRKHLERIGALIESPALYGNLTAQENLLVHTKLMGLSKDRIDAVLETVDLKNTGSKTAAQFSTGMKQRLGIAIALLGSPELLILDEPANGLDPIGIQELRELIRSFPAKGMTVIVYAGGKGGEKMINIILVEYLKYKRTFTRKLIVLAPLFFIIIALPQKFLMPANYLRPWQLLLDQVYNWWPVIFIPLGTALFAALVQEQEKKSGNYRGLRMHNVSPAALWTGKIIVMAGHTLLATLVLMISIIISGLITAGGAIPWLKIFAGGFTIWFVSLAVIPLQLWAATRLGITASMTLGILGLITGVMAAPKVYWIYIPWSWPTRLMCPIIGVHPNGTLLEPGSRLLDPAVMLPGFAVSLAALLIFTAITAWWFNKREVL